MVTTAENTLLDRTPLFPGPCGTLVTPHVKVKRWTTPELHLHPRAPEFIYFYFSGLYYFFPLCVCVACRGRKLSPASCFRCLWAAVSVLGTELWSSAWAVDTLICGSIWTAQPLGFMAMKWQQVWPMFFKVRAIWILSSTYIQVTRPDSEQKRKPGKFYVE